VLIIEYQLQLTRLPVLLSGKLDRQRLKDLASTISADDLALFQRGPTAVRPPDSVAGQIIAQIWADLLRCALESISLDDHFFRMGGDSVKAMRLASQLHQKGYTLAVDQIFRHPTLESMANMVQQSAEDIEDGNAFGLVPAEKLAHFMRDAAHQCRCRISDIVDVYPSTPVQEGLMAASADGSDAYVASLAWILPSHINLQRLHHALITVIEGSAIWRTSLFHTDGGLMQCVLRHADPIAIITPDQETFDLEGYLREGRQLPMGLGQRLVRFTIVDGDSVRYLTMTAHHCVYDGWMLPQMFRNLEGAYLGEPLSPVIPFPRFVHYVHSRDQSASQDYWRSAMDGASIPDFPEYPQADYQPRTTARMTYRLHPGKAPEGITIASAVRAAWALLLGKHTDSQDVVFGVTMTGRAAPVPGIEEINGPCISTTPARVQFGASQTVGSYLEQVQQQVMDAVLHEQMGLQHIRKVSTDCAACCDLRTVLVVQTGNITAGERLGFQEASVDERQIHNDAVNLQCILEGDEMTFDVNYDGNITDEQQMVRILRQLEHLIHQLTTVEPSTLLCDLSAVSPNDLVEIRKWNSYMPSERSVLMHRLIEEKVAATPGKEAIDAWDGRFTYREFDRVATRLAHYLVNYWNVVPDEIIPLYFEKSKWTAVAMYAIMKAGAAYAFIGLQEPPKRIQSMLQTTRARLVISSETQSKTVVTYIDNVVALSAELMETLPEDNTPVQTAVTPENVAYVLFTSGYVISTRAAMICKLT
jgi:aryl carrier-like protein